MLKNGEPAPLFSLPDAKGAIWSSFGHDGKELSDPQAHPERKITVMIFHRGVFCPTTDRFLTAYQDFYRRMKELAVDLIAISTDKVEANAELGERLKVTFPLLADGDFSVAQKYGVYRGEKRSGALFCEPALVIVDVEGKVAYSVISSGPKGLPQPGDVAAVLLYMHTHQGKY